MAADLSMQPEFERWDAFVPPGRRGAWPWAVEVSAWLAALGLVLLTGASVYFSVGKIESRLDEAVRTQLRRADVDTSRLQIGWQYRDITLAGELPPGFDVEALSKLLRSVDRGGIRRINLFARESDAPLRIDGGKVDVSATLAEGRLVLEGSVLTDEQREKLIDAATDALGITSVTDKLIVTGLQEVIPGADDRIAGMAEALAGLRNAVSADVRLVARDFRFNATASDVPQAEDLLRRRGVASSLGLIISGDIIAPTRRPSQGLSVVVEQQAGQIVLTGTVLSTDQWRRLDNAARAVSDDVVNSIQTLGTSVDTAVADQRVAILEIALEDFGKAEQVRAKLAADQFLIDATVAQQEHAAAMLRARRAAEELGLSVSGDINARQLSVQREVDLLNGEIESHRQQLGSAVVFAAGDDQLNFTAKQALDRVVDAMVSYQRPVVRVAGHTDSDGARQQNRVLSLDRAAAVVDYLVKSGIDPARLHAVGLGESEPLASNSTEFGRRQNRRVEFLVLERH